MGKIYELKFQSVDRPAYSPDLTPSGFFFSPIITRTQSKRFINTIRVILKVRLV